MRKYIFSIAVAVFISGCAGVSIIPISSQQAIDVHSGSSNRKGYIVYEPIIVVEVSKKEVCKKRNATGKCVEIETICAAGTPFTLPDYSKPYIIDVKSGFGKAGVELEIKDGWMLGKVKDNSDNAAILGTVEKLLGIGILTASPGATPTGKCEVPGLYRVNMSAGAIVLEKIKLY